MLCRRQNCPCAVRCGFPWSIYRLAFAARQTRQQRQMRLCARLCRNARSASRVCGAARTGCPAVRTAVVSWAAMSRGVGNLVPLLSPSPARLGQPPAYSDTKKGGIAPASLGLFLASLPVPLADGYFSGVLLADEHIRNCSRARYANSTLCATHNAANSKAFLAVPAYRRSPRFKRDLNDGY